MGILLTDSRGATVPVRDERTYYRVRIRGNGGGCVFTKEADAQAEAAELRKYSEPDEVVEVKAVKMDADAFERLAEFDGDYS